MEQVLIDSKQVLIDSIRNPSENALWDEDDANQAIASEYASRSDGSLSTAAHELAQRNEIKHLTGGAANLKMSTWRVIWALILANGSRKLSKKQYQSMCNLPRHFC